VVVTLAEADHLYCRAGKRNVPPMLRLSSHEHSAVALLLIDVINDQGFEDADALLRQALPMAHRLAILKRKAAKLQIPIVYVNDNLGHWKSDFRHTVEHCCSDSSRGAAISRMLRPADTDYFVLKPKHSGFYATTLDLLLEYLHAESLIPGRYRRKYLCALYGQ
jgi:nicotinamidase-related amidase